MQIIRNKNIYDIDDDANKLDQKNHSGFDKRKEKQKKDKDKTRQDKTRQGDQRENIL